MTRHRASRQETEQRIELVMNALAQGASSAQVVTLLMTSKGVSERQARRYIEEARKSIAGLGSMASDEERGLLLKRTEFLFQKVSSAQDWQLANQILGTSTKLYNLRLKNHDATSASIPSVDPGLAEAIRALNGDGKTDHA